MSKAVDTLIKIYQSLIMDGWDAVRNTSYEDQKEISPEVIERNRARLGIKFTKDNHEPIDVSYNESSGWGANYITSFEVDFKPKGDYKVHYKVIRVVANPSPKQLRSFLMRLDNVQSYKQTEYQNRQLAREENKRKEGFITSYVRDELGFTDNKGHVLNATTVAEELRDKISEARRDYLKENPDNPETSDLFNLNYNSYSINNCYYDKDIEESVRRTVSLRIEPPTNRFSLEQAKIYNCFINNLLIDIEKDFNELESRVARACRVTKELNEAYAEGTALWNKENK